MFIGSMLSTGHPVLDVGLATFFFGFGAGAVLNLYLLATSSPLIEQLRGSLNYKSSIIGDGLLLPIVNAVAMSFLRSEHALVGRDVLIIAVALGLCVTAYFHIVQAMRGLVNWAMPSPWRWNLLGAWHAGYMFAVATFLSLFYAVSVTALRARDGASLDLFIVTTGIALFFVLLRLDYVSVRPRALIPWRVRQS